jgi:hypothetical protein
MQSKKFKYLAIPALGASLLVAAGFAVFHSDPNNMKIEADKLIEKDNYTQAQVVLTNAIANKKANKTI